MTDSINISATKHVEVFKTNVCNANIAAALIEKLQQHYPCNKINFDLSDCDNILRLEGENICTKKITEIIKSFGWKIEILL